ncbi:MAG: bifunctional methylenetetrahydrofolate dehydrogenase/methenyltetrahydrofolate cyclohydrolase FolD [Candidatus Margulisiibacteriota bacterium]
MGKIIDGKLIAATIRGEVKNEIEKIKISGGRVPGLTVILVGDDPGSQVYVRNKERACQEVGISSEVKRLPATTTEAQLIELVRTLNADDKVDGILVQLPLPKGNDEIKILNEISPDKDVDGLHPLNMGKLFKGEKGGLIPCTPQGAIELILSTGIEIRGKEAVVVGRSNIVGKPLAMLLLQHHATVTICHSRTKDLGAVTRRADILVAAIGQPKMITGEMVKPGAVVIDVGTSRVGEKLAGDVDFESAKDVAGYITPVPGGVGPMTIAMLMKNTLAAAKLRS